jgi:cysteine-rich repeat protein
VLDEGEACDDGNNENGDGCRADCVLDSCGDGIVQGVEPCDLGPGNADRPAFLVTQLRGVNTSVRPLVLPKSSTEFYAYWSASSHTGFEVSGESRAYLYVDSRTARLSLVLTHGKDDDQATSQVNMVVSGIPSGFAVDIADDKSDEFFASGPSTAVGSWQFDDNSDGGVIGGLPFPASWKITVAPDFVSGILRWTWVREDQSRVALKMSENLTIEAFDTPSACRTNCTVPRCGDKVLDGGEVCDDGNTLGGDGCAADCRSFR